MKKKYSKESIMQFLRAQVSSFISTICDFGMTFLLHYVFGVWIVAATMAGTCTGGITNFFINRNYVFDKAKMTGGRQQGVKYILVWTGNLILNASGVYLLADVLHWHKAVSKVVVSLIVAFFYNYLLQKNYVFKTEKKGNSYDQ